MTRQVFNLHKGQKEVLHFKSRFKVIVAGRRWGKSKLAAISLVIAASRPKSLVWYVAPTYSMCKSIMWPDLTEIIPQKWIKKSNETTQSIQLINGSRIELKGCDKPDSLRGVGLHYLVIDEAQDIKKETWTTVLRPTLSDKEGNALIIGTPKGFNWLYDVYQEGQKKENRNKGLWASWQFPTITSPFIPPEEIASARKDMDERVFRQEFEACHLPETKVLMDDYSCKRICEIQPNESVLTLDNGVLTPVKVENGGYTGEREIVEVTLENGDTFEASFNHKIKLSDSDKPAMLKDVDFLEYTPTYWKPTTREEKLAALSAYLTGDGSIVERQKYVRKDGSSKISYQGAFYSNEKEDLENILKDCQHLSLCSNCNVTLKKNNGIRADGYQLQFGNEVANLFINLKVPFGKKTINNFEVPDWIMSGTDGVKRAYLSALFGAEGNTPIVTTKNKCGHSLCLNMCKKSGYNIDKFFNQLSLLLIDLNVKNTVVKRVDKSGYQTATIYIDNKIDNRIRFFENVGYTYCHHKSVKAFLFTKYLKYYKKVAEYRKSAVDYYRSHNETRAEVAKKFDIRLKVFNGLIYRTTKSINSGHDFPRFEEWISLRWNKEQQLLRLAVVKKEVKPSTSVFNILVGSKDHSYILANGLNNFNSFETMSGRVYYPFDRKIHVSDIYNFDPHKPIYIGMDFNVNPMTAVVLQPQANGEMWAVDEIVLHNSSTAEMSDEIERRYWRYMRQIYLFPDPASNYRNSSRGESDIDILNEKGFTKVYFRRKHPSVQDRINAVNKMLKSADGTVRLFINEKCQTLIESFEQTLYKENTKEIDKAQNKEHITDACGYCIEYINPIRNNLSIAVSI